MGAEETPRSWSLHFGEEPFTSEDRRVKLVESICLFLLASEGWDVLCHLQAKPHLVLLLDFEQLCTKSRIEDLQAAISHQPQECLSCLNAAVFEVSAAEHVCA